MHAGRAKLEPKESPRTQVKVGYNSIAWDSSVPMLRWEENPRNLMI